MGVFCRPDSPYWHVWLEGVPASRARINTKIPIGATPFHRKESRKLAEQVFAALMGDRARDRFGLTRPETSRTFAQQRAWYTEHVTSKKRGAVKERSILRQLGVFLDGYHLSSITKTLVLEWRTVRLATVAPATVNREEAVLKHLLGSAVPTYLAANPLAGLTSLRETEPDTRIFTVEEEDRLLAAVGPEDRALVLVALDTLLRLSNVRRLTRQQDHGAYLYSDTKVGAVKIPISSRLRRALDELPDAGQPYFPTYAGQKTVNGIGRMFSEACRRAKVQVGRKGGGVSFHCLRHTGASRMLAAGTDVKTVMRIGGWKNLKILERYLHPTDAAAKAAVETIGSRPTTVDRQQSLKH